MPALHCIPLLHWCTLWSCSHHPCVAHLPYSSSTRRSHRTDCCGSRWLAGRRRWGRCESRWCGWGTAAGAAGRSQSHRFRGCGPSVPQDPLHPATRWEDTGPERECLPTPPHAGPKACRETHTNELSNSWHLLSSMESHFITYKHNPQSI